jgi:hypothetical protein
MIAEKILSAAVQNESFTDALDKVDVFYRDERIDEKSYREYIVYLFGRRAQMLASQGNWLEAAAAAGEGMEKAGADPRLRKARDGYTRNFAVEKHNEFADAFNSRDFAAARRILEAALLLVPDNSLLKQDLKQLQAAYE